MFDLCFCLEYLEDGCLTHQSRFTLYVFFEYTADVSLISACTAQLHTIMVSPFSARGGYGGRVVTLSPPTSEAGVRSSHGLKWGSW